MPTVTKRVEKNITYKFLGKKDELGSGAFGKVYKWKRIDDGKEEIVAVKTMKMTKKDEKMQEYEKETLFYLSAGNKHPNIVNLLETFTDDSSFGNIPHICFVMEFASGGDLDSRIKKRLDVSTIALVMKQILKGLAFLEDNRIVHSDIKPANILLVKKNRWEAKISDFGLAKMLPKGVWEIHYSMGGTLRFMAPECRDKRLGFPLDIWATGVTMWNMIIGRDAYPFNHKEPFEDRYRPPDYKLKGWEDNPDARNLIKKMFIIDPQKRITAKDALKHKWIVNNAKKKAPPRPRANDPKQGKNEKTKKTKRTTKHEDKVTKGDTKHKGVKKGTRGKTPVQNSIEETIDKQMKYAQQMFKTPTGFN